MHATTCVHIEDSIQNEIGYMQKDKYDIFGVLILLETKNRIMESYSVESEGGVVLVRVSIPAQTS